MKKYLPILAVVAILALLTSTTLAVRRVNHWKHAAKTAQAASKSEKSKADSLEKVVAQLRATPTQTTEVNLQVDVAANSKTNKRNGKKTKNTASANQ